MDATICPFRPPRRAKPRVHGTQTAFVVGGYGKEIDVDPLGRVDVEFRWDRRDRKIGGLSRRVRVSQGWAGPGSGFVMLPRVGDEVIVSYLDGDPDEPIVIGRVHNAVIATPLTLPKEQTQSVWRSRSSPGGAGFNQILMEDAAGAERLDLRAERDFRTDTGRNSATTVGVDQSTKIGGHSSIVVAGTQSISAGAVAISAGPYKINAQTVTINASVAMTRSAGDVMKDNSTNHFIETGGLWVSATSIVQMMASRILLQGDAEVTLVSGGSAITITPGGITIASKGPVTVTGSIIKLNC